MQIQNVFKKKKRGKLEVFGWSDNMISKGCICRTVLFHNIYLYLSDGACHGMQKIPKINLM
jgi:hypothetical protein